jgi:hypothetical protein
MDKFFLRDQWRRTIESDGGHCPVCDRWGRIYARGINKTMAHSLIWLLFAEHEDGWVDVPSKAPKWLIRSNQLSTLRWWDLVERCPNDDPKNKHSGMWRVTELGEKFVNRRVSIPEKVFTYNGEVEGKSNRLVTINECFDDYFDYQEIMKTYFKDKDDS